MRRNEIKKIIILLVVVFGLTGCFKRDSLEDVDIYTTVYPIEYVTDYLYGKNSNVDSIYPAETDINKYKLSKKQMEKYADGAVFIYNGLTDEKIIARDLLNMNTDLKIIDVSQGLEYTTSPLELWMNPNDFLMLAHNVKDGLKENISNKYIKEEIEKNYEDLKVLISGYDAKLEIAVSSGQDKNIIIASSELLYLEKYGFDVTDITDKSEDNLEKAEELIKTGKCKYIYTIDSKKETESIKDLKNLGGKVKSLRSMTIRTEDEIAKKITYKNMMENNIDAIKAEVIE